MHVRSAWKGHGKSESAAYVSDEKLDGLIKVMDAAAGRRSTKEILDGMRGVGPELRVENGEEAGARP